MSRVAVIGGGSHAAVIGGLSCAVVLAVIVQIDRLAEKEKRPDKAPSKIPFMVTTI
jgi:hypothetical protein